MNERNKEILTKTIETINMFLKRLSAVLVTTTCLGWAALGAAPETSTTTTNNGKENSVMAPLGISVILTPHTPKCNNEINGSIDVSISGDYTTPFTYRYKKDLITSSPQLISTPNFTIQNLSAGTYTVYISDNGLPPASGQSTIVIDNPAQLLVTLDMNSLVFPKCVGETATIKFNADGGVAPYTYSLYKNSTFLISNTTGLFAGLSDGLYSAIITDANGCSKNYDGSIKINKLDPISIAYSVINEIRCDNDLASVQITSLPTDVDDPFDIVVRNTTLGENFENHNSQYVYTNLKAGDYTATVSRRSCPSNTDLVNFSIEPFTAISVVPDPVSPVNLNCGGSKDLTDVKVRINGGNTDRNVRVVFDNNNGISTDDPDRTGPYQTLFTFDDVAAGNYTIRWYDVKYPGTCNGQQDYVINNPASPLLWVGEPTVTKPLCFGDANGTMTVNVSGGTGSKTIYVNDNPATIPINRVAGTYSVYVSDANGCTTETKQVTIPQQDQLIVSYDPANDVDVNCPGGNNGEIHMTVTGGAGGYSYSMNGTVTRPDVATGSNIGIIALPGGTYNVQVKDKNNCTANAQNGIVIDEPDPIQISTQDFVLDTIQCNGETATLMVKATGGSDPNMTYKLYKETTLIDTKISTGVVTFSDLVPASYTLNVQSDLNCPDFLSRPFTVVDRRKLEVVNVNDTVTLTCPGDVPSVTLTVSGEAPFSYSIEGTPVQNVAFVGNNAVISAGLTPSAIGFTNRIIVTDKYACANDIYRTIIEPSPITTLDVTRTEVKCNSKRNGSISLTVRGGTPGYTLSLINALTSQTVKTYPAKSDVQVTIPALYAGTYNLQIKDFNGCLAPTPPTGIIITEPDSLVIEEPVYTELKCNGDATDVYFNVTGGWAGVDKTVKITGSGRNMTIPAGTNYSLKAGTYTLTATNTDGCYAASKQFTIAQPEKLVLNTPVVDNVSCYGANDAKITFSVTGGTPDYLYGLRGAGTASIPFTGTSYTIDSDLAAGTYNLVVQDANNCQSSVKAVTITEPAVVTFNVRFDSVTCNGASDGKIIIENATGGDNVFKAYLTKPGGTEELSNFPVIDNLPSGTYQIRLTDSKDCTSETKTVTIGQPEQIVITNATISDSLSCYNDQNATITIEAIGGRPYNLQYKVTNRGYQSTNKFFNLPSGEYEIWVKNSKGNCETKYDQKLFIINPDEVVVTEVLPIDVSCYNLQDGSVTIKAEGGTGTLNYYLIEAPVSIQPNPSTTGQFDDLGDLNSTSTIYNFRVEDQKGCKKTGSFPILNPPELKIKELDHQDVVCNDQGNGWIELEVTGGTGDYSFQKNIGEAVTSDVEKINDTSFRIIKYKGGDFTPVVIDEEGCSKTLASAVTIVDPPILKIDSVTWGKKMCNGDRDDVTTIHVIGGTPGYYYSLDNGTTYGELNDSVFVGEAVGNKYPMVKDKNSCLTKKQEPYYLTEPTALWISYEFTPIECFDDQYADMELKIVGGTEPYIFSYKEAGVANGPFEFANAPTDTTTILLSKEEIKLNPDITYEFFIQDANKCHVENIKGVTDVTDFFVDTIFTKPTQVVLESMTPHGVWCGDSLTGRIEFVASGGTANNYADYTLKAILDGHPQPVHLSNGLNTVEHLRSGLYFVTLTDANGCLAKPNTSSTLYTDTTTIDASNKEIELKISKIDTITCNETHDGAIEISVKNFLEDGIFWEAQIWENDTVRSTRNHTVFEEGFIEADSFSSEGYKGHMLFSTYSQKILDEIGIGRYIITVIDSQSGCRDTADFILFSALGDSCPPLSYYNAFTQYSGGDKYNNWNMGGSKSRVYNLKVFTAWGELVYDSNYKNGEQKISAAGKNGIQWDGTDNKQRPVPAGTYIYLLHTGVAPNDTLIDGNITILRNNGR